MARTAGGIDKRDFTDGLGRHRRAIRIADVVFPVLAQFRCRVHTHPGRAQGVLDEELDHVGLGIELRGGNDLRPFDLGALLRADFFKYAIFFFRIPVLIRPAECVRRLKDLLRAPIFAGYRHSTGKQRNSTFESRRRWLERNAGRLGRKQEGQFNSLTAEYLFQQSIQAVVLAGTDLRVDPRQTMMFQ